MDELFEEASLYGRITIYQNERGLYAGWVSFNTIGNVELKAQGESADTVRSLLMSIIKQAKVVVKEMGKEAERFKQIENG